jgi:hypothetical protein
MPFLLSIPFPFASLIRQPQIKNPALTQCRVCNAICRASIATGTSGGYLSSSGGIDRNPFPVLAKFLKLNNTVYLGKQGVIPTTTNVFTRMDPGAQLPDKNVSSLDGLAAISFYTSALSNGVATVS